jgi:hypothetical protein
VTPNVGADGTVRRAWQATADDGGVGIVGAIDPEHAGLALLAGMSSALLMVATKIAFQRASSGPASARRKRSCDRDVEAGEREHYPR